MRVFKTKYFNKWAKKIRLTDVNLVNASNEIQNGLVDADLGFRLYKKRVAVGSKGKSGGARLILAYEQDDKVFFLYGFEKNQRENIAANELKQLKIIGDKLIKLNSSQIQAALKAGELIELNMRDKGN